MSKDLVKKLVIDSGALRVAARWQGKGVALLMYHSVSDNPNSQQDTLGGIAHSTLVFRGQMEVIAREFNPITIEDLFLFLKGQRDLPSRPVVVTFDDGYADNYHLASPILEQFGIPGVFYVTVDCVERQMPPWPAQLRFAFLTSGKTGWADPDQRRWSLATREDKIRAFERASEFCGKLSGSPQSDFIAHIYSDLAIEPVRNRPSLMMSWDQVRGLLRAGHTVGSHTMTHPNMAHVGEQDARREFLESKRCLERKLGQPAVHFSYPCPALQPHWREATVRLSREIGYKTAVTANGGLVRAHHEPLCLRRIRPTKQVAGLRWNLECTFAGRVV
ncbi:MAG: polysaccharide deacetylase family protein [Acidobacteria bacterium]|nr:polysaccharide deacetylase family protein [Acidobacteriota bacterium]